MIREIFICKKRIFELSLMIWWKLSGVINSVLTQFVDTIFGDVSILPNMRGLIL